MTGISQTQLATQNMTPRTRALLPDSVLDARLGRGTVAGALNDQIRFRVERTGTDASTWTLAPDSPQAHAIMQSRAGARLVSQMQGAVGQAAGSDLPNDIKGFALARDVTAVRASGLLAVADSDAAIRASLPGSDRAALRTLVQTYAAPISNETVATTGAWNDHGWITFLPKSSRLMLAAAGAYTGDTSKDELAFHKARGANFLNGNSAPHEFQHSITPATTTAYTGPAAWLEEGLVTQLSGSRSAVRRMEQVTGVTPHSLAARQAQPSFDTGWEHWRTPRTKPAAMKTENDRVQRNYTDGPTLVRELVHLAGADFRSTAGRAKALDLLQGKSMRFVPGVLADAIIEHNGLDPQVREPLRQRIAHAADLPGGVAAIAKEFGIE
jgi:hypothetical protein